MSIEVTSKISSERSALDRIAKNEDAAKRALKDLRTGIRDDWAIVACWRTGQFNTDRHFRIINASELMYVLTNYLAMHCHSLRIFALRDPVPVDSPQQGRFG